MVVRDTYGVQANTEYPGNKAMQDYGLWVSHLGIIDCKSYGTHPGGGLHL